MKYPSLIPFIAAALLLSASVSVWYVESSLNDRIDRIADNVDQLQHDSNRLSSRSDNVAQLTSKFLQAYCTQKGGLYEASNQDGGGVVYIVQGGDNYAYSGEGMYGGSFSNPTYTAPKAPPGGYHDTQCTAGGTVYSISGLDWVSNTSKKL